MLVYLNIMAETIVPDRYRIGRGDRVISFLLGILSVLSIPFFWWASGPYWWPWGMGVEGLLLVFAALAFRRWWSARESVHWVEQENCLEFRQGNRTQSFELAALTRVRTLPAQARTLLQVGKHRRWLSHRLINVEFLLERLRTLRPDLCPFPEGRLKLRSSKTTVVALAILSLATAGVGWQLLSWVTAIGVVFLAGALFVILRILLLVPQKFVLGPGYLRVVYLVRWKTWKGTPEIHQDRYVAGGAVFFRMRLKFGKKRVDLDEGQLIDPLRPWVGWIVECWSFPRP